MGNANIKAYSQKVTSANTDTQVFLAPWRAQRRYVLNKLLITNESTSTIATVKIYDRDLGNPTPPVRGDSANAPLLEFAIPINSTLVLDERTVPKEFFVSGMVAASPLVVVIMVEIKED